MGKGKSKGNWNYGNNYGKQGKGSNYVNQGAQGAQQGKGPTMMKAVGKGVGKDKGVGKGYTTPFIAIVTTVMYGDTPSGTVHN